MLVYAGVALPSVLWLPETFGPVLLKRRAQRMRRETGRTDIVAKIELQKKGAKQMMMVTLMRPIRLFFLEAIVLCSCIYAASVFGIFYLFFEAYPLIFQGDESLPS